jgi:hypothetical protein
MNLLAVRSWFRYGPPIGWGANYTVLREYIALSLYLYVCFAALLLYKAAILRGHHIEYAPYGLAVCKALLLAKFIVIGRKLGIGRHFGSTLIHKIIHNSVVFLFFVVALSAIEVTIGAIVHHRTIGQSLAEGAATTPAEIIATSLLLFLVLIPYFAYREIHAALGQGKLLQLLRGQADGPRNRSSVTVETSPSGSGLVGATQSAYGSATTNALPASHPTERRCEGKPSQEGESPHG